MIVLPPEIIELAAYELEQEIIKSAAEDGSDMDNPELAIFESQRDEYRKWMAVVLPIVMRDLLARQEPLGEPFQRILYENLSKLYEE